MQHFLRIVSFSHVGHALREGIGFFVLTCLVVVFSTYWCTIDSTSKNYRSSATRVEKICIIGAGSSGIHLGYLLKRRGFHNTVIFEQRNRTGGDVWTLNKNAAPNSDGITRELGVREI